MSELAVKGKEGLVSSGDIGRRVLCYYSTKLDVVEIGYPTCMRALCAIAMLKGTSHPHVP